MAQPITMALNRTDGDQGFPGNVKVVVTYRFENNNALRLDFTATIDKTAVINLTSNIYFNLSGNSTVPAYSHVLPYLFDLNFGGYCDKVSKSGRGNAVVCNDGHSAICSARRRQLVFLWR